MSARGDGLRNALVEELRRVRAINSELLDALREIEDICSDGNFDVNAVRRKASAAIARATGQA